MKILNLYAGIGGNRKLWGDKHDITAVEIDPEVAMIYKDFFPGDKVIVGDSVKYLLEHYEEYDFIWASPPCQTHSKLNICFKKKNKPKIPDMTLYSIILFLRVFAKAKWVIENVRPYYKPLIQPDFCITRHMFWASSWMLIADEKKSYKKNFEKMTVRDWQKFYGFDLSKYPKMERKLQKLRNCVNPEIGKYVFESICGEQGKEL